MRLEARGISRYYGGRTALAPVDFSAAETGVTVFLGPNGAGKSTLMQILCGVLAPSTGRVSIAGHDLMEAPIAARRQLGYLPEQPPLYPESSVDEYLVHCGRLRGLHGSDLTARLSAVKQRTGLADVGRRVLGHLSKGYQQRVGIAQTLLHNPAVIVLDEPSSGLDPNQMVEMRDLIRELGSHACVILSTHILTEAEALADRILIIRDGHIILDESAQTFGAAQGGFEPRYLSLTADSGVHATP